MFRQQIILMSLCVAGLLAPCTAESVEAKSPHVVFVTGDDEYRSEISMPMIAEILEARHNMRCTVLYATEPDGKRNPKYQQNIAGLDALDTADLAVIFVRFRALPDDQLERILDYVNSGRPIVGLRTSTHAFRYPAGHEHARYNRDFGREVFGQRWIRHHGHGNSTRVLATVKDHPIMRGIPPEFWVRSWLYHVVPLVGDCVTLAHGYAVKGGTEFIDNDNKEPNRDIFGVPNPVAWTKTYRGARVFFTTLGHPKDFDNASVRRLLINGIYWALGLEEKIPSDGCDATIVGDWTSPDTH